MNLNKLLQTQAELDKHIVDKKGLHGQDLLDKKILALQVELGELCNKWRGFKFWSENQEPRTKMICAICYGAGGWYNSRSDAKDGINKMTCRVCKGSGVKEDANPLLEEYVDVLHFLLSIGNEINIGMDIASKLVYPKKMPDILDQFMWLNKQIVDMYQNYRDRGFQDKNYHFIITYSSLLGLGEMLGFTWEQIEDAYYEKNETNHQRQENGY